jgi:hypothetical protein
MMHLGLPIHLEETFRNTVHVILHAELYLSFLCYTCAANLENLTYG